MLSKLKNGPRVVGLKQSRRAISDGNAAFVFLASDADPRITDELRALCAQNHVPFDETEDMKTLGSACEISVGAAAAVLLKQ